MSNEASEGNFHRYIRAVLHSAMVGKTAADLMMRGMRSEGGGGGGGERGMHFREAFARKTLERMHPCNPRKFGRRRVSGAEVSADSSANIFMHT